LTFLEIIFDLGLVESNLWVRSRGSCSRRRASICFNTGAF